MANEGRNAARRIPFKRAELVTLYAACKRKDDDLRRLIAMLADTGARLAEVAGLALADIVLDAVVPPGRQPKLPKQFATR